ncbi:DUF2975 domain-containing protein [Spirosoma sp. BT702]|uniref:DUF2975 domain-containing protein n=1 Tax=Spirosoma profusum TaxID=2771354 RepID=A0A927AVA7_9BACT|nr:DUF2975 domain-containing protein [Spirosoma profusum]MBD2705046.1 DUF2975 domain-containing protein [Spirosoma profusum]
METNSPYWVFPTVKRLVTLFYYLVLAVLVLFAAMSCLKLLNAQTGPFPLGQEQPNYISIPVAWAPASDKTITTTGQPQLFLTPQKQTGQLQVPIRSVPGLLMSLLGLVGLVTAAWMFFLLRQIFRSVHIQSPFQAAIARRITTMGFLFLGQTTVELLLKLVLWHQTRPYFGQIRLASQAWLSVDIQLNGPWLLGLILLALAQVYRRGIELQLENELTV